MSQHTWGSTGSQGGHNGEYYYMCSVCTLTDWLPGYNHPPPDWHADEPCVPVAQAQALARVKRKRAARKKHLHDLEEKERDQVAGDWLLEHGFTPERVKAMMSVELLKAAFAEVRPLCEECGEPGTRRFRTDGDEDYWLCDSLLRAHSVDAYQGDPIPQPALREYLDTPEPEICTCVDEASSDENCPECQGSGWVIPEKR